MALLIYLSLAASIRAFQQPRSRIRPHRDVSREVALPVGALALTGTALVKAPPTA
eukprot:CAMPEP_0119289340 /NCGR_PEP_ID=MMETSP1329-20130426/38862_1 /TAXON_ID=114041 /ORGANISM="Genus nov. species nov., Strain RCC1024" /LENGTH=54 /DNA_ID=CAMNT_0007290141 /DNA_START=48 /DNA_END=208 /DNA_ORIENTATION=+